MYKLKDFISEKPPLTCVNCKWGKRRIVFNSHDRGLGVMRIYCSLQGVNVDLSLKCHKHEEIEDIDIKMSLKTYLKLRSLCDRRRKR